jgi:pimeloyl-ACP methyl ester carboxylesterase
MQTLSRARERGTDVWLIHGLGDAPRVWLAARKDVTLEGYRLIAPALPGFGGTPPLPARERGLEGLARWVQTQIARRSRGRRVILVGHSMGGMLASLIAARTSDLSGLINVEGPLTLADCDTTKQASRATDFPRWFRAFRRMVRLPESGAPAHYGTSVAEADGPSFLACAKDIVALASGARMAKLYAAIRAPHIFFYGAATGGISRRSLTFLQAHGCETKEFAAAAHWPMTETPRDFARALIDTIERFS